MIEEIMRCDICGLKMTNRDKNTAQGFKYKVSRCEAAVDFKYAQELDICGECMDTFHRMIRTDLMLNILDTAKRM